MHEHCSLSKLSPPHSYHLSYNRIPPCYCVTKLTFHDRTVVGREVMLLRILWANARV